MVERAAVPRLGLAMGAELGVTPALVRLMGLLVLPTEALQEVLEQALSDNPALVAADGPRCPGCGRPLRGTFCGACRSTSSPVDPVGLPAEPDPRADLLAELGRLLPVADRPAAEILVADLDGHGLLGRTPDDAAAELRLPLSVVRRVLAVLSTLDPPGLGSTSLAEALAAQVDAHPGPVPPLVRVLVRDHLQSLGPGVPRRIPGLAASPAELAAAVAWIRAELRPPSLPLRAPAPVARQPDVMVTLLGDGRLAVEVVTGAEGIEVDRAWERLAADRTGRVAAADLAALRARIADARELLLLFAERAGTLRRVAEVVVAEQRDAVLRGDAHLRDLTRERVARRLGVHPSTVSRVVANKVALLPDRRVVPLAAYFGVGLAARRCLRSVLAAGGGLSDGEAAAELVARGYPVSRRTVAKYRADLGIPAAPRHG